MRAWQAGSITSLPEDLGSFRLGEQLGVFFTGDVGLHFCTTSIFESLKYQYIIIILFNANRLIIRLH